MFVHITIPARGITSTKALVHSISIGPRLVYNVIIYKGINHKIVLQKKMIVSFWFLLKF